MFTGSVNDDMRKIIREVVGTWNVGSLYVGCSGNFTVEGILRDLPLAIHSNDVSIYSCALGAYLTSQPFRLEVKDDRFAWLTPYLATPEGKVAALMLSTGMLAGSHRQEPFFQRKREAYLSQWPSLFEKTVVRIGEALESLKIKSFYAGDVVDFAAAYTDFENSGFISFPPTYKGGYERLYQALTSVFDWDEPEYQLFDDERLASLNDSMLKYHHWCTSKDAKIEALAEYEIAKVQTTLLSKPVYIYASSGKRRISNAKVNVQQLYIPRFTENDEITESSVLQVTEINVRQLNLLRSLYMNPKIAPARSPTVKLAVTVDGKLIGALAFSTFKYMAKSLYLMTDFAISAKKYPRLSKLILAVMLSKEVKDIAENRITECFDSVYTTAFTAKPCSMKYRGLFELYSRSVEPPMINYRSKMGRWTLKEAMKNWHQKHGAKI